MPTSYFNILCTMLLSVTLTNIHSQTTGAAAIDSTQNEQLQSNTEQEAAAYWEKLKQIAQTQTQTKKTHFVLQDSLADSYQHINDLFMDAAFLQTLQNQIDQLEVMTDGYTGQKTTRSTLPKKELDFLMALSVHLKKIEKAMLYNIDYSQQLDQALYRLTVPVD